MIDLITHFYSKGYRLRLSDGNDWWITGYGNSIKYVEEFADIMTLEECPSNDLPKLIYFKRAKDDIRKNTVFQRKNLSTAKVIFRVEDYRIILIWYGQADAICELKNGNSDGESDYLTMWYSLYAVYQRSMKMGGLPFHSGLAEFEGKGVLLAGISGSGKSTCYRRLPNHWKPLCDDETLVVLSKDNIYQAHPCPTWSDYLSGRTEKKYNIQYSVPVSALFFLEQSETDEVIPIPPHQASIFITRSSTQIFSKSEPFKHRKDRSSILELILNNAVNMAKTIPAFILRVSLNGHFWEEIKKH